PHRLLDLRAPRLQRTEPLAQGAHLHDQPIRLCRLAIPLQPRNQRRRLVALRTEPVGVRDDHPPLLVQRKDLVDELDVLGIAAAGELIADELRFLADAPQVEHATSRPAARGTGPGSTGSARLRSRDAPRTRPAPPPAPSRSTRRPKSDAGRTGSRTPRPCAPAPAPTACTPPCRRAHAGRPRTPRPRPRRCRAGR